MAGDMAEGTAEDKVAGMEDRGEGREGKEAEAGEVAEVVAGEAGTEGREARAVCYRNWDHTCDE